MKKLNFCKIVSINKAEMTVVIICCRGVLLKLAEKFFIFLKKNEEFFSQFFISCVIYKRC